MYFYEAVINMNSKIAKDYVHIFHKILTTY